MTVEKAIISAFEDEYVLPAEEIEKRLPFCDAETIVQKLVYEDSFVRISERKYAVLDRIEISDYDVQQSESIIKKAIQQNGYCTVNMLCSERSELQNPDIPPDSLKLALFEKCLSDKYSKKYRLISPLGSEYSVSDALQNYCVEHSSIELSDLEDYETGITGEESKIALSAALKAMVRVGEDQFVRKDKITFDIDVIDDVISEYLTGQKVISITSIQTFGAFPYVLGYMWNSFLLEGYLMHFSRKWTCMTINNDKEEVMGGIYSKNIDIKRYDDLLALAAADSGIVLNADNVNELFIRKHYRKRKLKEEKMDLILSLANKIRLKESE